MQNELKKAKKETKKRKSDVKIDEAAPTAKELKLTAAAKEKEEKLEAAAKKKEIKDAAKVEIEKQAKLVSDAPERPPGTVRAYFVKQLKLIDAEVTKEKTNADFGKLTDDEKRELKA